jgi:Domain of unknown function (DUF5679)
MRYPAASNRRWLQIRKQFTALLPVVQVQMEQTARALDAQVDKLAPKRKARGRPSPKKERAQLQAAKRAEREARSQRPPGRPKEKRSYVRQKPFVLSEKTSETQAYCPKCRDRRDLVHGEPVTFTNGRLAIQGRCAICKTRMARIVARDAESALAR